MARNNYMKRQKTGNIVGKKYLQHKDIWSRIYRVSTTAGWQRDTREWDRHCASSPHSYTDPFGQELRHIKQIMT